MTLVTSGGSKNLTGVDAETMKIATFRGTMRFLDPLVFYPQNIYGNLILTRIGTSPFAKLTKLTRFQLPIVGGCYFLQQKHNFLAKLPFRQKTVYTGQ